MVVIKVELSLVTPSTNVSNVFCSEGTKTKIKTLALVYDPLFLFKSRSNLVTSLEYKVLDMQSSIGKILRMLFDHDEFANGVVDELLVLLLPKI